MKLNYKIIFHFFGLLLLFNGGFMLLAALLSFFYKDGATLNLFLAEISNLGLVTLSRLAYFHLKIRYQNHFHG